MPAVVGVLCSASQLPAFFFFFPLGAFIHIYMLSKHAHIVAHLYVPMQRRISPGCCGKHSLRPPSLVAIRETCLIALGGVDPRIITDDSFLFFSLSPPSHPTKVQAEGKYDIAYYGVHTAKASSHEDRERGAAEEWLLELQGRCRKTD